MGFWAHECMQMMYECRLAVSACAWYVTSVWEILSSDGMLRGPPTRQNHIAKLVNSLCMHQNGIQHAGCCAVSELSQPASRTRLHSTANVPVESTNAAMTRHNGGAQ